MNPVRHQGPRRTEWEGEVIRFIEEAGDGMSTSDAQAIMDAQPTNVDMLWKGYLMPKEAAYAVLEFSGRGHPLTAAQEAIAQADAYLNNVGLPNYTELISELRGGRIIRVAASQLKAI